VRSKDCRRQTGHGRKRRRSQRSNLSSVKTQKLVAPRLTKWITDDESSYDDESDSETSQTSDDIYSKYNFVKLFEEINVF
jgi:hypothetical protein